MQSQNYLDTETKECTPFRNYYWKLPQRPGSLCAVMPAAVAPSANQTCFVLGSRFLSLWIKGEMARAYIAMARGSPWVVPLPVMNNFMGARYRQCCSFTALDSTFELVLGKAKQNTCKSYVHYTAGSSYMYVHMSWRGS